METTSANPPVPEVRKAIRRDPDFRKLIRTRLRKAKLAAVAEGPDLVSRSWSALRRGFAALWRGLGDRVRRAPKSLTVCETAALGDRRMVSVVQFERQRFLIGCSPASVTLLARLADLDGGTAAPGQTHPEPRLPVSGGSQ